MTAPVSYRARPITVLVSSALLFATSFLVQHLVALFLLWCWCVALALLSGIEVRRLFQALLRAWPFVALPVALNFILVIYFQGPASDPAHSAWRHWLVPISSIGLRAFTVVTISVAILLVHSPQRYLDDLFRLRFGPVLIRRLLSQLELLTGFSLSFIPLLQAESQRIALARTARGLPQDKGLVGKLRFSKDLLFPLLVSALKRSETLALALRCRGYDPQVPKTHLAGRPVTVWDGAKTTITALGCVFLLFLQNRLK